MADIFKFNYSVKAKNFDGIYTDYVVLGSSATRIEQIESSEWEVGSSSIGVKAVAEGGQGFSNIGDGLSAIYYEIQTSTGGVLGSTWTKTTWRIVRPQRRRSPR